jgi:thymidylate synthase (FAD)
MDARFKVEVLSQTLYPNRVVYAAMHQDYESKFVYDHPEEIPEEAEAGQIVVKRLLAGNRGHYGPLEHPQLVLNFGYFPHAVLQQVRTHRNLSFDVQSFRYTSENLVRAAQGLIDIEDVVYLRPVDDYTNRQGKKYSYTEMMRQDDLNIANLLVVRYADRLADGISEEHARSMLPFDVRQHWVMSGNARSIMHLLDIRGKFDVQPETRVMTELLFEKFKLWMPEVGEWYENTRWRKGRLAP